MEKQTMETILDMIKVDTDKAWDNVKNRIRSDNPNYAAKGKGTFMFSYPKVAAAVLLIMSLATGLYLTTSHYKNTQMLATSQNETKTTGLPDGSTVDINASSSLKYSSPQFGNKRKVELEGEAFFNVASDASRPFLVKTKDIQVQVVGTSFNIMARENRPVEVYVGTGKVLVFTNSNPEKKILLEPGQLAILNGNEFQVKSNSDSNYLSWKTRKLFFNGTPLADVAHSLSHMFNISIELTGTKPGKLLYTATIVDQPLESIIEAIQYSFIREIDILYENGKYIISQK